MPGGTVTYAAIPSTGRCRRSVRVLACSEVLGTRSGCVAATAEAGICDLAAASGTGSPGALSMTPPLPNT